MKSFSFIKKLRKPAALVAAMALAGGGVFGQMPGAPGASGTSAAMIKLFGTNTGFSSRSEFIVLDKAKKETTTVLMNYALLDGKTRTEIDLNQLKSVDMPPALVPTMKQLGMDLTVVISRPDKKVVLSIFPRAKSYIEVAMSKDEAMAADKTYAINKVPLGKETIDGHPCEKDKVTLTAGKGDKLEPIVWYATDMNNFPIRIEMPWENGTVVIVIFKDVKLTRPEAKQFEAPAGLTRYTSGEALADAMAKTQTSPNAKK
jgi:hypothetical protein